MTKKMGPVIDLWYIAHRFAPFPYTLVCVGQTYDSGSILENAPITRPYESYCFKGKACVHMYI